MLVDHVKNSDTLVLMQSKEVLHRPWCLIALDAAITHGVPIVALTCVGKGYDFVTAIDFLHHLETCLETADPDALGVLKKHGVDPIRLAHKLHSVVPNVVSISLNTSASDNSVKAAMAGLVKAVQGARALPVDESSFEAWLANRKTTEQAVLEQALDSQTIRGTQRGRMLMKIERADEMEEELREARAALAAKDAAQAAKDERNDAALQEERAERKVERAEHKAELGIALSKSETRIEKLESKIEKLEAKLEAKLDTL